MDKKRRMGPTQISIQSLQIAQYERDEVKLLLRITKWENLLQFISRCGVEVGLLMSAHLATRLQSVRVPSEGKERTGWNSNRSCYKHEGVRCCGILSRISILNLVKVDPGRLAEGKGSGRAGTRKRRIPRTRGARRRSR